MPSKKKKAHKKMKYVEPIKMPYNVMRFFVEGSREITFANDQASLGEDYGTIEELRDVVEWLADQFGGKVEWND